SLAPRPAAESREVATASRPALCPARFGTPFASPHRGRDLSFGGLQPTFLSRVGPCVLARTAAGCSSSVVRAASVESGSRMAELGETICPYCGVGCRLRLEGTAAQVTRVRGVESAPANQGRICAKGAQLGPTIATPDRLAFPQLRVGRHNNFERVTWDVALRYVAEIF